MHISSNILEILGKTGCMGWMHGLLINQKLCFLRNKENLQKTSNLTVDRA